jgi:hypothetical protein
MSTRLQLALAGFLLSLMVQTAPAAILSGEVTGGTTSGVFIKLSPPLPNPFGPPNSVGDDNFNRPNFYGFDEDQNIILAVPLAVDIGSPLLIGRLVSSHYIFFDPGPIERMIGTVNFDGEVLAIVTSTINLANSDFLANTGVNYLNPTNRGLELETVPPDAVTISGLRQIGFDVTAATPGDYIRVLTAGSTNVVAAPEPGTFVIMGLGLAGMAALRLRRTRKPASP